MLLKFGGAVGLAALTLFGGAGPAAAACQVGLVAELPVVMDGNQPLVKGSINGKPMVALADTGAFNSMVWRGAAARYGLPVKPLRGLIVSGVGGSREAQSTSVKELKLGDQARRNLALLMAGQNQPMRRPDLAMILGQDILSNTDVEFDLSNNVIRFLRPIGCGPTDSLAYWGGNYAEVPIERVTPESPHIIAAAQVNGRPVRAMLDTGAWTTVLDEQAARRVGIKPEALSESVRTGGVGKRTVATSLGTFDTLTLGNQTVRNAKLRVSDIWRHSRRAATGSRLPSAVDNDNPDLIIGADFFRAHRVLVSYSQRRVYFSHNGQPIFQTQGPPADREDADVAASGETAE